MNSAVLVAWDSRRNALARAALGGFLWLGLVAGFHPSPFETRWAVLLLIFSPLVLVPLVARLASRPTNPPAARHLAAWAAVLQCHAALLLAVAIGPGSEQGLFTGLLALPWLAVTGLYGVIGVLNVRARGVRPLPELAVDAGLIFLPVGGIWVVLHASGIRPLDFKPVIVLLTAIHFHYAGLVLPILAGLAGRRLPGRFANVVSLAVVIGVPLVAAGITLTQLGHGALVETLAAWVTAAAGLGVAWLHVRLAIRRGVGPANRGLWLTAAGCLAGGMVLAALYGSRSWVPQSWHSLAVFDSRGGNNIQWMRAWHGTLNALGFGLCGCLGWLLATRTGGGEETPRDRVLDPRDLEYIEAAEDEEVRQAMIETIGRFRRRETLDVGEAVPPLVLPRLEGEATVRIDGPRPRPLVLIFGSYT